ncbi:MAG: anti-anti-sigma factor [Moraxellaceae bacterium]|nr:MAG: anti-anti-sigma factor [Moraxellaceae bacterium]
MLKKEALHTPVETELSDDSLTLTIKIVGHFNFELAQEFRSSYEDSPAEIYAIDMRNSEYMDSSALGMLMIMRNLLGNDTIISIVNCTPQIEKILYIARLDKLFDIFSQSPKTINNVHQHPSTN